MKTCNSSVWNVLQTPKDDYGQVWSMNNVISNPKLYGLGNLDNFGFDDYSSQDNFPVQSAYENTLSNYPMSSNGTSDRHYDQNLFDVLKVEPETYARQITLIELEHFKKIDIEEFLSFKWNSKEKIFHAPNIVASTKWFNQLIFWVQREILNVNNLHKRVEVLSLFIRIAKCLEHMNNLYSAMAIISALQVQCIHRLKQTWAALSHKDKAAFRRLEQLFSTKDNSQSLREHTDNMKLPGIPYIGMYLSDLTFIHTAFPVQGGLFCPAREDKINNILRIITNFQQSDYSNFSREEYIDNYLKSQRYIEELQKFIEDSNYKLSQKLEPDYCPPLLEEPLTASPPIDNKESPCKVLQPLPIASIPNDDLTEFITDNNRLRNMSRSDSCHSTLSNDNNLSSAHKADSCQLVPQSTPDSKHTSNFKLPHLKHSHKKRPSQDYASSSSTANNDILLNQNKGHRKTKSVGADKQSFPTGLGSKCSSQNSNHASSQTTNLLDDSPVSHGCHGDSMTPDNLSLQPTQTLSEQGIYDAIIGVPELDPKDVICECSIQRKTIRVKGRPTRFSMWHRFWIVLANSEKGAIIYYFKAKALRAVHRNQFAKSKRKEQLLNASLTLIKSSVTSHQCKQELTQPLRHFHLIDSECGKTYLIRSVQPRNDCDSMSTYDLYLRVTDTIKASIRGDEEDLINLEEEQCDGDEIT